MSKWQRMESAPTEQGEIFIVFVPDFGEATVQSSVASHDDGHEGWGYCYVGEFNPPDSWVHPEWDAAICLDHSVQPVAWRPLP